MRFRLARRWRRAFAGVVTVTALLGATGCGGGGADGGGAGGSFILLSFAQSGQDNVPLNRTLSLRFSDAVDPATVGPTSIQIREGSAFGRTVAGAFRVSGSEVSFEPRLPGLCDLSDAGLHPDTTYRITIVGYPEDFAVRSQGGVALAETLTYEFITRPDDDPLLFEDQVAGVGPSVLSTTPANATAALRVEDGNEAHVLLSENVDPCSVSDATVLVHEYQRGDPAVFQPAPNGNASGFVTPTASGVDDATPGDPFTWGATNLVTTLESPQKVRATIRLVQSFTSTEIVIRPESGRWPDDALVVVELTFGIEDFGGLSLVPSRFSFTTENLTIQSGLHALLWEGETPIDAGFTTADVNTARAPSRAQGFLLFAGDGDNGSVLTDPTAPAVPPTCTLARQVNDGTKDSFDPTSDALLDTGSSPNACANSTDGSTAVVWEFNSFRIRSGVTVRLIGRNPAIILVQGDVLIESGGRLLARGDGNGGSPQGRGGNGNNSNSSTSPVAATGGVGVAGAGSGGSSTTVGGGSYGGDGFAGFGSPNVGVQGGIGSGQGNTASGANGSAFNGLGNSPAGGGGGHAAAGATGQATKGANEIFVAAVRGAGGGVYPAGATADEMLVPSAGSGGGAAGYSDGPSTFVGYDSTGGAGAAGGGFVDLTSAGDIQIFGTLDAAGSRGGNGAAGFYNGAGGGGGGSGGGIRLLTPNEIDLQGGTVTVAGGGGGSGGQPTQAIVAKNAGGNGGSGRLVLETGDSLVAGLGTASVTPTEGQAGFFRSVFNASRFRGGGLTPQVLTDLVFMGPNSPQYLDPVFADFPAGSGGTSGVGIPSVSSRGLGKTGILIEARGHAIQPDGDADPLASPYYTIGYFKDSGQEQAPTWVPSAYPADIGARPADNAGDGITSLNDLAFLQIRITFFLPSTVGPFDPGPYIDNWNVRFQFDQ